MNILVTGGTGFIGSHLTTALSDYISRGPHYIKVLSSAIRGEMAVSEHVDVIKGDITDYETIARAVENVQIVFHLAGKTGEPRDSGEEKEYWRVNVEGTKLLAKLAARTGVQRMVNFSSGGVYGGSDSQVCDEGTEPIPLSIYARTKLAAEAAAEAEASGYRMKVVTLRPSNIFGERHPSSALLTLIRSIKIGYFYQLSNTPDSYVNYVYVGDVVDAAIRLALAQESHESTYIVNTPVNLHVFAAIIAAAVGRRADFIYLPRILPFMAAKVLETLVPLFGRESPLTIAKVRSLENRQIIHAQRLQNILPNWPRFGLTEGLNRLIIYYREAGQL